MSRTPHPERRHNRLPDTHPAVHALQRQRAHIAKLEAVAEAARAQNDLALYQALKRLGADDGSARTAQHERG